MLCEACQLVDFRPPSLRGFSGSTLRKIPLLPRVLWDNCSHLLTDNPNIASFYHRHHSSLDSLRESAERGCQLCRLFLCGLEKDGGVPSNWERWTTWSPLFRSSEVRIYPYDYLWGSLKVKNTTKYSAVITCGEKICGFSLKTPSRKSARSFPNSYFFSAVNSFELTYTLLLAHQLPIENMNLWGRP